MSDRTPYEPLLRRVMPELDSIRGLAILGVLFYHGFYWQIDLTAFPPRQSWLLNLASCGRMGVNLFFVISGFLITGLLLDSCERPDYYKRFYLRRAKRILPAYVAILGILALLRCPPAFLALSAVFLSNLTPLLGIAIAYPVLWSLAVEEHFYLAWPAAVRRLSQATLLKLCVVIIVASPILRFVGFHAAHDFRFNDYTWNAADGLACGAVVAILVRMWDENRGYLRRLVVASLATALLLSPFAFMYRESAIGSAMQVVPWHALFTGVLGALLLVGTSKFSHVVQIPILRFFGRISYGLYLVHLLVFQAFDRLVQWRGLLGLSSRFCVAGTAATALAWLSREYFEERFLRHRHLHPSGRESKTPTYTLNES